MTRPARTFLDPQALRNNLSLVRRKAPGSRVMAVVKANGYGHGLRWAAQVLTSADAFAVASVEEAVLLRTSGTQAPICLLEGFFSADDLPLLDQHRLSPALHHVSQLEMLEQSKVRGPLTVWVKIDTGMHRLGFAPGELPAVLERLRRLPAIAEIGLMSHFANADQRDDEGTRGQIRAFLELSHAHKLQRSLANSAGILGWPESHLDWVRPGIMLYGSSPLNGETADSLGLQPVMTLTTQLIAVQRRQKGDRVGYGGDWTCPEDMTVGVAAIGYGDGYPRHAPAGTPVLVNGQRTPLIGRVSMDMITLDLRAHPNASVGDPMVLWGRGLPVDEIAASAGTISYELMCHVAERIPRIVNGD
ncbi:MAG: alanine racemase [Candidatus Muproteobacteria bacterium RBG_16_62_13]|uniref:Alanine racemase n=1 Tax=Candidatus Muproteobacteria bacterium RBG_16_62_13 TaxID=1817756 RepID=A0A1F6T2P4_9PROT|nr:MAG: alanine racemase [Candidatus Muproteobacteria bacterium RBG_16_62_13]